MALATVPPSRAELLATARDRLAAAGCDRPREEAATLWRDLFEGEPLAVRLAGDAPVAAEAATRFLDAVRRRAAGEPRAYVAGVAGFRHLTLRVDPRGLIPRPETEGLVDLALRCGRSGRAADVGTGSGCVALSLRQEGDFAQVVGIDVSAAALDLARGNGRDLGLPVTWLRGDLTSALATDALDLLVSNPPYLTAAEWATLDPSVRDWEPALALASGPDGLHATRRLLDDGRRVLRRDGWMVLEVDSARASMVAELARASGWEQVRVEVDLFGRERFVCALNA